MSGHEAKVKRPQFKKQQPGEEEKIGYNNQYLLNSKARVVGYTINITSTHNLPKTH